MVSFVFSFLMQEFTGLAVSFGIGTYLTNDFRSLSTGEKSKPLNIVIKLSSVNDSPCIKLSDDITKVRMLWLAFLRELKFY